MVALFVFCVNYTPLHLAFELHLDDLHATIGGALPVPFSHVLESAPDDDEHQSPHLATDHLMRLVSQTPSHFLSFEMILADAKVALVTPQRQVQLFLTDRQNPPGIPPPDPLQPRAPPLA